MESLSKPLPILALFLIAFLSITIPIEAGREVPKANGDPEVYDSQAYYDLAQDNLAKNPDIAEGEDDSYNTQHSGFQRYFYQSPFFNFPHFKFHPGFKGIKAQESSAEAPDVTEVDQSYNTQHSGFNPFFFRFPYFRFPYDGFFPGFKGIKAQESSAKSPDVTEDDQSYNTQHWGFNPFFFRFPYFRFPYYGFFPRFKGIKAQESSAKISDVIEDDQSYNTQHSGFNPFFSRFPYFPFPYFGFHPGFKGIKAQDVDVKANDQSYKTQDLNVDSQRGAQGSKNFPQYSQYGDIEANSALKATTIGKDGNYQGYDPQAYQIPYFKQMGSFPTWYGNVKPESGSQDITIDKYKAGKSSERDGKIAKGSP